jgi:hypothetical protein
VLSLNGGRYFWARYNLGMMKFAELDRIAFKQGFDAVMNGGPFTPNESSDAGYTFGIRLLKSLNPNWDIGDSHNFDRATIDQQLRATIAGDITLLPSPAELESELTSASNELFGFLQSSSLLPQEIKNQLQDDALKAAAGNKNLVAPAADNRQEKYQFDRDAAGYILLSP